MDSLIGSKPYMNPVATVSSTVKMQSSSNDYNSFMPTVNNEFPNKKLKQVATVDKILLKIEENRELDEERRERRHQEKLQIKREALDILSRMANALEK